MSATVHACYVVCLRLFQDPSSAKDFVYSISTPRASRSPGGESSIPPAYSHTTHESPLAEVQDVDITNAETGLPVEDAGVRDPPSPEATLNLKSLAITPAVPKAFQPLFSHFINVMTMSISCHKGIQDGICSTVVPMALEVPHLLSAVLALAAAHRHSSGFIRGDCQFESMKGNSLKQLRSALSRFRPAEHDQVLATTLILCMAEVISPMSSTSSWRSHLHGAATLSAQYSICNGSSSSSTSDLLRRKYQALQAVALACGSKAYDGCVLGTSLHNPTQIDDLAGYSTSLLPIFREINDLDLTRRHPDSGFICNDEPGSPHFDCNSPVEHQSHLLFDRIVALMATRKMSRTQDDGALEWTIYQDLYRLDEAYHHMAILQVFRRGCLSVPLQLIDESRQAILECLTAMEYQARPCPAVAALPPLFVAGSLCTSESDRMIVRRLLKTMWMKYGMGNVRSCRTVLEQWWKQQDDYKPANSGRTDWQGGTEDVNLSELSAFTWTVGSYDVLPY